MSIGLRKTFLTMALSLEPVRRVRLMSLVGDFATCTERSEGPVTRRGNMFETRRPYAPLGAHGLSFLVETGQGRARARGLFDFVLGVFRWTNRVVGYAFTLVTDQYPPFRLSP